MPDWCSTSTAGSARPNPARCSITPISEAGERGPFVNAEARASFVGLSYRHGFGDMVRAVIEGIGFAARDCYQAMGGAMPAELRLTGGAIRSPQLRQILSACVGVPVRSNSRGRPVPQGPQ